MERPQPPAELLDEIDTLPQFIPSAELEAWLRESFLKERSPLFNREHIHLNDAVIGCLWTNVANTKGGNIVAATCEIPQPTNGSKWQKARQEMQLLNWFGQVPDFLFTFDAGIATNADDTAFCALCDHELYHAGQARDAFGMPKFRKSGLPAFTLRGHDVEEFVGVVRRWGTHTVNPNLRALVEAAGKAPAIARTSVELACGNCQRVVA